MQADFYILAESFQSNANYADSEIEEKVKRLAEDVVIINKHSVTNKLLANYSAVYPLKFHSNYTIEDFLCRPQDVKKTVDRDVVNAVRNIFEKATDTKITSKEVIETLLPWQDNTICHGLIAFHKLESVKEEVQLVYGIDGWYKFRRHFLGLYPDAGTFIDECAKYFPNIYFHQRNKETVLQILENFSKNIIKHVGILNDIFFTYRTRTFENETIKYRTLTSECNLDADAASKDNNDNRENLTFEFINDKNQTESVTCYPHLRICKSDNPGDGHYYQHRIYFHEGIVSIQNKKILVGHIGIHL